MTRGKVWVHNVRDFQKPIKGIPIYVGRDGLLGNPYKDTDAVERFAAQFAQVMSGDARRALLDMILLFVRQGFDVTLVCWCKPAPCHGDVIAKYLRMEAERLGPYTP